MENDIITVMGATSLIGQCLVPRLLAEGYLVQALSRRPQLATQGMRLHWLELQNGQLPDALKAAHDFIHLAPIWELPAYLPSLAALGIKRIIAFSSTSQFTKRTSKERYEQAIVAKLAEAERQIQKFCQENRIAWIIFRPTLIYGKLDHQDFSKIGKGLASILQFIKICRFFPLVGQGKGLRQPVLADDLALACILALKQQGSFNHAYNLSGGETLSYRQMLGRLFATLEVRERIIPVPLWMVRVMLSIVRRIPKYHFLTAEMADRMNQDMVFEHTDAQLAFGYNPQAFLA